MLEDSPRIVSLISVIGTTVGFKWAAMECHPSPNLLLNMSYVHITGERKKPARTRKFTKLMTSGTLHAIGANIRPMLHPVNDITKSQNGRLSSPMVTGKSCMKKKGIKLMRDKIARA
tara:strand:- start:306 stop:656 length:351 start_codon:yes stop_codon:yes gene_type:complete